MERKEFDNLIKWKNSDDRKPLIIRGARQTGKTWLLKEFGQREFKQNIYINFENSKHLKNIFENDFDIKRIITSLQVETGVVFDAQNTLIIFDEIQDQIIILLQRVHY